MTSVKLRPSAIQEAAEAYDWYEKQREGLGDEFMSDLEKAQATIAEHPTRPAFYDGDTRYERLARFPFLLIYRCLDDEVEVLAVAHVARRPGYWKDSGRQH